MKTTSASSLYTSSHSVSPFPPKSPSPLSLATVMSSKPTAIPSAAQETTPENNNNNNNKTQIKIRSSKQRTCLIYLSQCIDQFRALLSSSNTPSLSPSHNRKSFQPIITLNIIQCCCNCFHDHFLYHRSENGAYVGISNQIVHWMWLLKMNNFATNLHVLLAAFNFDNNSEALWF